MNLRIDLADNNLDFSHCLTNRTGRLNLAQVGPGIDHRVSTGTWRQDKGIAAGKIEIISDS